ncbi:transposase [Gemmata massiliana]|uniref:transposase n=1 Tax=Gemmata massiliana TaxID=1210884 RepID=UPI0013A6CE3C|nr:transposase [Gemmata massiliana]
MPHQPTALDGRSHAIIAPTAPVVPLVSALAALVPRSAPRLARLFVGAILARGRQTVTSWIRAAGLGDEYRSCYTMVAATGSRPDRIAARLLREVVKPLVGDARRLSFALDDTPTERYGPHSVRVIDGYGSTPKGVTIRNAL